MRLLYSILFCMVSVVCFSQQKITHTVYFDFDIAEPNEATKKELSLFIEKIKPLQPDLIIIRGHADMKGSSDYNKKLSAARAAAVNDMISSSLPPGSSITVSSYGKEMLLTEDDEKQEVNRRVEIEVYYTEKQIQKPVTEVEPFFEDVETQRFPVNLDDTVIVVGKEGTFLKISPGSITNKKGLVAKGNAVLLLKEYYQPGDILLSGLNTNSEKGPLETGGMFNMIIVRDNDTMSSKMLKPVTIRMPVVTDATGKMNIYTIDHKTDSSVWSNTNNTFDRIFSFWEWPRQIDKLDDLIIPRIEFKNWRVGHKYTDEYRAHISSWNFFSIEFGNSSKVKMVTNRIEKIDSVTLRASLKVRYRNRGLRKYGTRYFDTTFLVKYRRAEYVGISKNISWINCDRFLNCPDPADFYVSTPEFRGASVLVYFKSQNAYLPAYEDAKGLYKVVKVPPDEKVWIVAFGKKNGQYYYSKKEFIIEKNARTDLTLAKMSEEDFRKQMKSL
ncbi:MAG TPA: OmpA family protein [Chitinophagaceae bacterium]|nr:OmpA family protein [Chitinophagaceae bacterium]